MRRAQIPIEFASLNVQYVQQQTATEYSSSCPKCGGSVHPGGEWPDRFRMFTDGKIRAWCRKCDYRWYPDMSADWRPDAEDIARRAEAAERALHNAIEQAQQALEELQAARKWIEYHEALGETGRSLWLGRGIDAWFQDWWKLGYSPSTRWGSASITIPVWGQGWEVTNIKHRLLASDKGRYRQEQSGIPASAFMCDPDRKSGPLFLCEGEIKAMVTFRAMDSTRVQVAGMPSKRPSDTLLETLKDYEPIYLCPDPDAFHDDSVAKLCDSLGKRVRVVQLPGKIDDLINAGMLDKAGLRRYVRHAVII